MHNIYIYIYYCANRFCCLKIAYTSSSTTTVGRSSSARSAKYR